MKQIIRSLFKKDISSLNQITIDQSSITNNFNVFQNLHPDKQIIPVLKSNAYGHGIKQICSILDRLEKCEMVAVDSFPEYQIVRDNFHGEILILWQTFGQNYRYFDTKITHFAVWSVDIIKSLISLDREVKVHIFVNTGMNREWCSLDELSDIIKLTMDHPKVKIIWLMSHLACADEIDQTITNNQVELFEKALSILWFYHIYPRCKHISASAWLLKDVWWDVMSAGRLWIWLYGYNPLSVWDTFYDEGKWLKSALSLYSTVTAIQISTKNSWVWYNHTYHTVDDFTKLCTFGVGYFEWLDRRLSNNRSIIYQGDVYPMVWRISMNYSTFEVPMGIDIKIWDEICVISSNIGDPNSIVSLSDKIGTIVYEPIVKLDSHIKRAVV